MSRRRPTALFAAATGLIFLALTVSPAQLPQPPKDEPINGNTIKGNEIVQQFPSTGPLETAWKVRWREESGPGLIIVDAFFKKSPTEDWTQVLGEARLSECFVPYHSGSPRFWDVSYNFSLYSVSQKDAPNGKLLSSKPGKAPTVVMELRDDGLTWKDSGKVRRSQMLTLWGGLAAGNYCYVMEYGFRDDGTIRFRLGSTGHNYSGSETQAHMHNAMWRIDVNLGGPDHNSVELIEHLEPDPNGEKSQATTVRTPFNNGREGYADFVPEKFTHLRVVNTKKKNAQGKPWAYDLVPYRLGNSRHQGGEKEKCTLHDYWVTKNRADELHYYNLPKYIQDPKHAGQPENIADTDIVLWYCAAGHHEARSEDGETVGGFFNGATPVMWTTFELKPRDFWDRTPFFPAKKPGVDLKAPGIDLE